MTYDRDGRLIREKITYPKGSGKIEYEYMGRSKQPKRAKCEDDFYDKVTRIVPFQSVNQQGQGSLGPDLGLYVIEPLLPIGSPVSDSSALYAWMAMAASS
jgi:hypothetical protein